MEQEKVYTLLYSGTQNSEISGEFTLPDYLPDVRRILRLTSGPRITGKFMNGERLELEGEVSMTLLYLSEDNTVCAFSAVLPFSHSTAISGLDESAVITAKLHVLTPVCRLSGPRKCMLRAKPSLYIRALAAQDLTPDTSALSNEDITALCTRTEPLSAAMIVSAVRSDLRYAEDLTAPEGVIVSVLSCEVIPCIKEGRVSDGHAVCTGEFDITALCCIMNDSKTIYRTLHRRVPFSETLDETGITEDCLCEPDITVTSVTPTVTEEGRNLGVDFVCEAAVLCACDVTLPMTVDAFTPAHDMKLLCENHAVFRPVKCVCSAFSAAADIKHDEKEVPQAIIDTHMHAAFDRWELRDGRLILDGTLDISLLCMDENGTYFPLAESVPIHRDIDAAGITDSAQLLWYADCTQNSFTVKRDPAYGAIRCEAELSLMLSLSEKKPHSLPHALTLSSEPLPEPPKEPLILCYPEAGETVWDIAKHYRIPPALLCEANRLDIRTEFPDTKGLPLVIPKHPIFAKMKA